MLYITGHNMHHTNTAYYTLYNRLGLSQGRQGEMDILALPTLYCVHVRHSQDTCRSRLCQQDRKTDNKTLHMHVIFRPMFRPKEQRPAWITRHSN